MQEFLNNPKVREGSQPFTFPSFDDATLALSGMEPITRTLEEPVVLDEDRHPALARAAYASVVLEKVRLVQESYGQPGPRNSQLMQILPIVLDSWPTVREERLVPGDEKALNLEARIAEIVDQKSFLRIATEEVSEAFAEGAKPCFGTLEDSGGQYCSTLYTDTKERGLTVADVKRILHPLNWDICCPTFFHKMAEQQPNRFTAERWYRIVESISAEPDEYILNTALIFSLEERDNGLIINYRLDPNRQGEGRSAGIVEIDNGYIWVTPTDTGVRIRTSKEERVNGLSPTATAALGCLMGWGDAGKEMLAGTARKAMKVPPEIPRERCSRPGQTPPPSSSSSWIRVRRRFHPTFPTVCRSTSPTPWTMQASWRRASSTG